MARTIGLLLLIFAIVLLAYSLVNVIVLLWLESGAQ
jgi:hypothetical protein